MDELMQHEENVQVEVTLTIEGDWRTDPLKLLSGLREGQRSIEKWQGKAVREAREHGWSWDDIGTACGVSRQAAWERFSAKD